MKKYCQTRLLLAILILTLANVGLTSYNEDLQKELSDWNTWAVQNANSENFKAKPYKPRVETLNQVDESSGGMESLQFMKMYRYNHVGNIPDKIKLFKDFFEDKEEIPREKFYLLAAVWLKRQHYEMETGHNYAFQPNLRETIENIHAYIYAQEELKNVRVEHLWYEFDLYFRKIENLDLVDAAHWLVDGNLYAGIGVKRLKDIFDEQLEILRSDVEEQNQDSTINEDQLNMQQLDELALPEDILELDNTQEKVDIIDL